MKIIAIIQARMESTRLSGKVLKNICGEPILKHIVNRVSMSKKLNKVIIATSENKADDEIVNFAKKNNINYFRGSQENVLQRFAECAKYYNPNIVVRLTGDNALIDSEIIDEGIEEFEKIKNIDYLYYQEGLPLGMAVEIFRFDALIKAYKEATDKECLEHVTPYIYNNPEIFKVDKSICKIKNISNLRWTIDKENDFKLINEIYNVLYPRYEDNFHLIDILGAYRQHKEWLEINDDVNQVRLIYKGEKNKINGEI